MNSIVERFAKAIRPPTPAISDNPITWFHPAEHLPSFHKKIIKLTDGQLTAEAARYTHSFRTSMEIYALDACVMFASAVALGQIHASVITWAALNTPLLFLCGMRGIERQYEKDVIRIEQKHRADLSYR